MFARISFCAIAVLVLTGAALADVPDTINVQGILTDETGVPITDMVKVTLAIYDQESGGSEIWAEEQDISPDSEGRFNIYLGTGKPVGFSGRLSAVVFDRSSRWLEIAPEGYTPLPRVPFTTAPYAYQVETLNGSTGGQVIGDVKISGDLGVGIALPQAKLHVGGVPGTDGIMFPDGSLQTSAADGPPTANLWSHSIIYDGHVIYTNGTGHNVFITSINVGGAAVAVDVDVTVDGTLFEFRTQPGGSYLWTGGGVPLPLPSGAQIDIVLSVWSRITFVGFTD